MDRLIRPLEILSQSVAHKNLSAASRHVGLSQPQLSRVIRGLEEELDIVLLDRSTKRKSSWTPIAIELAQVYHLAAKKLLDSIHSVQSDYQSQRLHMACLEGLMEVACTLCQQVLAKSKVHEVLLDVLDQTELEEKFLSGDLDLILSSRNPGRGKPKYELEIGHQTLDKVTAESSPYIVQSPYELTASKKRTADKSQKLFVSNSLAARQLWFKRFGGQGILPSPLLKGPARAAKELSVLLIGHETLAPNLWKVLSQV